MSEEINQTQDVTTQAPNQDHERNFRALEQKYQRQLQQEREARESAERKAAELLQQRQVVDEDDDDDEPYIDRKKLEKKLNKFGQHTQAQTKSDIEKAVQQAIKQERESNWLREHKDFEEVMAHADKLALKDPDLAESILEMPNNFERQKLVYKNIKALSLHQAAAKPGIQQKIDQNRQNPGYQPSGSNTPPYATFEGDFSEEGKKRAYEQIQKLKSRLSFQ
jgi:hypothetical protein